MGAASPKGLQDVAVRKLKSEIVGVGELHALDDQCPSVHPLKQLDNSLAGGIIGFVSQIGVVLRIGVVSRVCDREVVAPNDQVVALQNAPRSTDVRHGIRLRRFSAVAVDKRFLLPELKYVIANRP